jgi:hypothetical protein
MEKELLAEYMMAGADDARTCLKSALEVEQTQTLHPEERAMLRTFGRTVSAMTRFAVEADCDTIRK